MSVSRPLRPRHLRRMKDNRVREEKGTSRLSLDRAGRGAHIWRATEVAAPPRQSTVEKLRVQSCKVGKSVIEQPGPTPSGESIGAI